MKEPFSFNDYVDAMEMAYKAGVKPGESFLKYMIIVCKERNRRPIRIMEEDIDMVTGNLREEGLKILNLNEEIRKYTNKKKKKGE